MRFARRTITCMMALALSAGGVCAGENLLKGGDAEDANALALWTGAPRVQNLTEKHSGTASIQLTGRDWIYSPQMIEVDPAKSYTLKAFIRVADGQPPAQGLLGLRFYTADKQEISPVAVSAIKNSATELAADAAKGAKSVLVQSAGSWAPGSLTGIAFDAAEDFSDLPNINAARVTEIKKKGEAYEVFLRAPLSRDYPRGTKVRQHRYVDYVNTDFNATTEWKEFSIKLAGQQEAGNPPPRGQFWKGTRYVSVAIFTNMDRKPENGAITLVDDVTFSEVTP